MEDVEEQKIELESRESLLELDTYKIVFYVLRKAQ